ncbi:MAG: hypothetical protein PWP03_755 [Candidatus Woesearchaeota archaeon]|nr:hypothetical protein [Candidatus Woesearchaeota archaeon]MDN5328117.1 hypothetical protein [Candidatus Woesearchaeota archaeon]
MKSSRVLVFWMAVFSIIFGFISLNYSVFAEAFEDKGFFHDNSTNGIYLNIDDLSELNLKESNETLVSENVSSTQSFYKTGVFKNLTFYEFVSPDRLYRVGENFEIKANFLFRNELNQAKVLDLNEFISYFFANLSDDILNYSISLRDSGLLSDVSKGNLSIKPGEEIAFSINLTLKPFMSHLVCKNITLKDILPAGAVILDSGLSEDTIIREECSLDTRVSYLDYVDKIEVDLSDLTSSASNSLVALNEYVDSFNQTVIVFKKMI